MQKDLKNLFQRRINKNPIIELEEADRPHKLRWDRCKLETISYGHGITTTPLQATALYAAMVNGGKTIQISLIKERNINLSKQIISEETSNKLKKYFKKSCNR